MSNTCSPPRTSLNHFHDKPVGTFVEVSRNVVIVRVTDRVDYRTPVACRRRDAVRVGRVLLTPCFSDVGHLVGWKISIQSGPSRAIVGSCFYLPGRAGWPREVEERLLLPGLEIFVYDNWAVIIRSRCRPSDVKRRFL